MTTIFSGETVSSGEVPDNPEMTEVEVLESWLINGHLQEDTVFDAESARQALDIVHRMQRDKLDGFTLTKPAIKRCIDLDADSYAVNTVRLPASPMDEVDMTDTLAQDIDISTLSSLGSRVLSYVRLTLENLDENEWDELETDDMAEELERLCLSLHSDIIDPSGIARLGIVAESIGLRLPKKASEPVAFIKNGNMGKGSGGRSKASY